MTTQAIIDYLTKQILIEKNIVTYRSLSRHFSIHVNDAKNELATFHHNAPYQSITCCATFLLSGAPGNISQSRLKDKDEDYDMDSTQTSNANEEGGDGEAVPQTKITIVNERDLEEAQGLYDQVYSVHVYSLSPAPLHDAGLLCGPTEYVRTTDKAKGPEFAATVGRLVGGGIKLGNVKKKTQPPAPVAGPSKPKPIAAPEVKAETKEKPVAVSEKPKASGKLDFFKQPEKAKDTKEVKKAIKKEPAEENKRMFFSKPAAKAASKVASPAPVSVPSPVSSIASENEAKVLPARGVKRKSSVGLQRREKSPAPKAAEGNPRIKRRVILSEDESDAAVSTKPIRRKSRPNVKTESTENSEAEREARALMDIDDDEVEKVSHAPSTNVSSGENDEDEAERSVAQDEDVDMTGDTSSKPKITKKKKLKTVVPIGKNGLKKKKVTKTRKTKDAQGYFRKEDYSDWESVESGAESEPPAPPKTKPKPKAKAVKKEPQEILPPPTEEKGKAKEKEQSNEKEEEPASKKAPTKKAKPTPKAKPQQKGLKNFFGPKKTT